MNKNGEPIRLRLDALQLSVALLTKPDEYVTSDRRLLALARHLGLTGVSVP